MKILYFGGQKSGKTKLASNKSLSLAITKPYYIATYDNSFGDEEMQQRIDNHKEERQEDFVCIEESHDLTKVIKSGETYLVDCVSMWLLNNLKRSEAELIEQLKSICAVDANIVFVLNDTNSGVIPFDKESRSFVDKTGIVGQTLASLCDEVYESKFGLEVKLKG